MEKKAGNSLLGRMASIVCFISVLSQLPVFVERGLSSPIAICAWLLLFAVALIYCRGKIVVTESIYPIGMFGILMIYYLLRVIVNEAYLLSDMPYVMTIAVFILLTGNMVGKLITQRELERMMLSFIAGCVILAAVVYIQYFRGAGEFSRIYLYNEKNSTAQILMTAVILMATVFLDGSGQKQKIIYLGISLFLMAEVFLMRSRATIIFIPFLVVLLLSSNNISPKMKRLLILAVLVVTIVLVLNTEIRNKLLYDILYAGRDGSDFDSISSGRVQEWKSFFTDLGSQWLLGHGRMKRESVILVSILEYGVIFGSLILLLAVYPLFYGWKKLPKSNPYRIVLICLAACYAINGVFEQLAPFGPGVKCFFLWFLMGILCCREWKYLPNQNKIK